MTDPFVRIAQLLGRPVVALVVCLVLGASVLVPGLGQPGMWEPQERQLADRQAPPADVVAPQTPDPPPSKDGCIRIPPKDALARSLTPRAMKAGRDHVGDSDFGRRLPLALLALVTVLATAGIAMRLAGARAGIVAAIVLLAMPLLVLQGRLVTSEIGTACGGALILYGLVAIARPAGRSAGMRALDVAVGIAAAWFAGWGLGFLGGGLLLGVIVPMGAFAAASAFGIHLVGAIRRRERIATEVFALFVTLTVAALLGMLVYQLYELKDPYPGISPPARQMFGHAIVPAGCWSELLGATWKAEDDLRFIFDSAFEQIAFGTYPWGALAPIAMAALLADRDPRRRFAGALALAWAGASWIATEAFQRKVGFTIYAGFPALAVAVGVWLDTVLVRRSASATATPDAERGLPLAGMMLVGLFFGLAVLDFGKDVQTFAEKLTSLLTGTDQVAYPKDAKVFVLKLKQWVLVLGVIVGLGVALWMIVWRPGSARRARELRRVASVSLAVAFAASIALSAFWAFVWQPRLSLYLSSKQMLETVSDRFAQGDQLVIQGDLGHAPRQYAPAVVPEVAPSRTDIVKALKRPGRVFAIAPRTELCPLHREQGDKPYYVLEERNLRNMLFTNRLESGDTDRNPLANAIVHKEPQNIQHRPKGKVVWDNRIQLLGWDLPKTVARGSTFEATIYYKVLGPVSGNWKAIMHFDGAARFQGDHEPISGICPTSSWAAGDYIIDRVQVTAGNSTFSPGRYELWIGFFTGSAPNFRNMTLTEAPGDIRDTTDRVRVAGVELTAGGCNASGGGGSSALMLGVVAFVVGRRRGRRRS